VERVAIRYHRRNRRLKLRLILEMVNRRSVESVLLIGVTPSDPRTRSWANLVEQGIVDRVTFSVTSGLEAQAGSWPNYLACNGLNLPFRDKSFDLVVSNAVIEHVGGENHQKRFVAEHDRVGQSWIITTPNRWFPVESHTRTLLLHWLPFWRLRQQGFTRLLSRGEFGALLPSGAGMVGRLLAPTFVATSRGLL